MTQPNKPGWIGSAGRRAALPGPLRELHRAVLRRFLETGALPAGDWTPVPPRAWALATQR
jgi:hypothetical protein